MSITKNKYRREYITYIPLSEVLYEEYNKVSKRSIQYFSIEQIGSRLKRFTLDWLDGNNPYEKFLYREEGGGLLVYGLRKLKGKSKKKSKKSEDWFSF